MHEHTLARRLRREDGFCTRSRPVPDRAADQAAINLASWRRSAGVDLALDAPLASVSSELGLADLKHLAIRGMDGPLGTIVEIGVRD